MRDKTTNHRSEAVKYKNMPVSTNGFKKIPTKVIKSLEISMENFPI
jgi:hypothetical protein